MKRNKINILVTGGQGYIGSHLIKMLLKNPLLTVVNFDKKKANRKRFGKREIFVTGNIKNTPLLCRVLLKYRVNLVVHLAGLIRVEESMKNPNAYFENNVIGGLKLLDAMEECEINKIIYASSVAVCGEPRPELIGERCKMQPTNFYGLTKMIFEDALKYYGRTKSIDFIVFRIFNVAGADPEGKLKESHNPETHLIPLALSAMEAEKAVTIYGSNYDTADGTCARDYIHVNDVCRAFLLAIPRVLNEKIRQTFNLGSGQSHTVLEVVKLCEKILKIPAIINWQARRQGDPARLVSDSRKIKKILNWKPRYGLKEMILHASKSN